MGGIIIVSYVLGFSILSWVNWREWNSQSFEVVERCNYLFDFMDHLNL